MALGLFFHTDVEDFAAVVREVARCLRPGGRAGFHHKTLAGFHHKTLAGFHHKTLAGFLDAFARAGPGIKAAREFATKGHPVIPWDIAVVAENGMRQ